MTKHVDALPTTIKVLLTIAGQSWRTEYDDQDGETVDEALLFGAVWDELVRLADEDPETEPEDFQSVSQDDNFAQAIVSNLN
ncbi:MAG: hypothetical protein ABIT09_12360 [Croceibacterium sp.]